MTAVPVVEWRARGILFDMDGVLMSSLGSVERSWRTYARERNVDPELAVSLAHGRRAFETVQTLRPDLDPIAELRVIEDLEVNDREGLVVLPGVKPLLRALPENSWAIVTSATERLARSRLRAAGIPVPPDLITAEMVTYGKPHPEPYQRGAELLGLRPSDCVVIEDAPPGISSGKAAGCRVLAVLGSYPPEMLMEADERISTLKEIHPNVSAEGILKLVFEPWQPPQE
jgi:sugar-phosphatase